MSRFQRSLPLLVALLLPLATRARGTSTTTLWFADRNRELDREAIQNIVAEQVAA